MLSFEELNKTWAKAARAHALAPLQGDRGPYRAIGDKTLALLDPLWAKKNPAPDLGALIEAGKTVRFWADPHFNHDNIRRMCDRVEFESVEAMNEGLWSRALGAGRESDRLVCLGDLALKDAIGWHRKLQSELGGRHVMVVGNHDVKGSKPDQWAQSGALASLAFSVSARLVKEWLDEDAPEESARLQWGLAPERLSVGALHWPVPPSRLPGAAWISLHGHIHNRAAGRLRLNCSVEAIDYAPKTLRELISAELMQDVIQRQINPSMFAEDPIGGRPDAQY